jgi:hypothetical protein
VSTPGALFASIIALLEDMHAVAFEGQAKSLAEDERLVLLRALRAAMVRLQRKLNAAGPAEVA